MTAPEPWSLGHLVHARHVDIELARRLERLVRCADVETAQRVASRIELEVAPSSGVVDRTAIGVAEAIVFALPVMHRSVQGTAVALLFQIASSVLHADIDFADEVARVLVSALPSVAQLAQGADLNMQAEFVDFASLCAQLDPRVADQSIYFLHRVADEVGGNVGASALQELKYLSGDAATK